MGISLGLRVLPIPVVAVMLEVTPARAHDGENHAAPKTVSAKRDVQRETAPFPIPVEARFNLIDQDGARRTDADFAGRPMLIFFGYANCEAICSVALPRMLGAVDRLGDKGAKIAPILITVDPERDTPEIMRQSLPRYHERLIGLTGDPRRLAEVRKRFQVESKQAAIDRDGQPIFAHGSFIYLIGADGGLLTLLPPIFSEERMAEIIAKYI